MRVVRGEVRDGFGEIVGSGLVLNDDGELVDVLSSSGESGESSLRSGDGAVSETIGSFIVPGLVDVHCHGGGGASFPDDLDGNRFDRQLRLIGEVGQRPWSLRWFQ